MASTTEEVMLHFGIGAYAAEARKTIDTIRFITTPQLDADEIINLLDPIWGAGYDEGYEACLNDNR